MKIYAAVTAFLAAAVVAVTGQQTSPSWNGAYTEAQAKRGQALYAGNCGVCHGGELAGGDRAPALTGPAFNAKWGVKPVTELLEYVHSMMPLNSPGGLSRQQSADI